MQCRWNLGVKKKKKKHVNLIIDLVDLCIYVHWLKVVVVIIVKKPREQISLALNNESNNDFAVN